VLTARRVSLLLVAALSVYLVLLGDRALLLLRAGGLVGPAMGAALLLLPVLGVWFVVTELRFGRAMERLGAELGPDPGGDDPALPRRPSGRVDRAAADAVFATRRRAVEAAPQDWRGWFRLALAYDDAGDRGRARQAMRRAIALHDDGP